MHWYFMSFSHVECQKWISKKKQQLLQQVNVEEKILQYWNVTQEKQKAAYSNKKEMDSITFLY